MGIGPGGGNATHFQNSVMLGSASALPARIIEQLVAATSATAGTLTYTAAQVAGGLFLRTQTGTSTDTFPTAALLRDFLINGGKGVPIQVGSAVRLHVRNGGSGTITVAAGTGGTLSGTATIAAASSKDFLFVFTNVGATPTYTVYSLGTAVF